jgi:ACT domain-containing protein
LVRRFEDKDDRVAKKRLVLSFDDDAEAAAERVFDVIAKLGGVVVEVDYERRLDDVQLASLTIDVSLPIAVSVRQLMASLETQPGLQHVRIQSL